MTDIFTEKNFSCRYYLEHYVKMGKFASRMKFVLRRMWGFGIFVYICKAFI